MIKGVLIIANGYANYDFGGMQLNKIIAWGYAKSLKCKQGVLFLF